MSKEMLCGHLDQYMSIVACDRMRDVLVLCVGMACDFMKRVQADPSVNAIDSIEAVRYAFTTLPGAGTMVSQQRKIYQRAVPRMLATSDGDDKKGAVFFSAFDVVTIMLQEST